MSCLVLFYDVSPNILCDIRLSVMSCLVLFYVMSLNIVCDIPFSGKTKSEFGVFQETCVSLTIASIRRDKKKVSPTLTTESKKGGNSRYTVPMTVFIPSCYTEY